MKIKNEMFPQCGYKQCVHMHTHTHTQTPENYLALKKKKAILPFVIPGMNLKGISLSYILPDSSLSRSGFWCHLSIPIA